MSNDVRKLKKRKLREERNKQERLIREKLAATKRQDQTKLVLQERKLRKDMRKAEKHQDDLEKWAKGFMQNMDKLPAETRAKVLHNIEILKALEEEYEKEQLSKMATNEQLESEGHITLQDKLNALHSELAEGKTTSDEEFVDPSCVASVGGSAECSFKVNQ